MDRYQVASTPNGPWVELQVTNNPRHALEVARASFDWSVVWVAKMKPLRGADVLPPPEAFWGEMEERISILYGAGMVEELAGVMNSEGYRLIEVALTGHFLDMEVEALVPDMKHPYGASQSVRANDFIGEEKRKPSLKELLE